MKLASVTLASVTLRLGLRRGARGCGAALVVLLCCSCHESGPPTQDVTSKEPVAPDALATAPGTPHAVEALPRSVAGVTLGMSVADAEGKLGTLVCHANPGGYQVCRAADQPSEEFRNVEVYVVHDLVVSVSYESPARDNPWDALNALIDRFGRPSLSGARERDKSGRLHEIYGWKDDASLYSVRFLWRDVEGTNPELLGTVIALWDRKGYQQWEAEAKPHGKATPDKEPARGPI